MLRSRVALAIIGMLLVGMVSAAGAAMTTPGARQSVRTTQNGASGASGSTALLATPTSTAMPTQVIMPTVTPTNTPSTNQNSLRGSIIGNTINASAQTFAITQRSGTPVTIEVDDSTQFQGVAQDFSGLTGGLRASVTGKFLANGDYLATVVSTSPPDN